MVIEIAFATLPVTTDIEVLAIKRAFVEHMAANIAHRSRFATGVDIDLSGSTLR